MGYLAIEIIALLGGAAVFGFILGWALFGLGRKPQPAPAVATGLASANPKLEADFKAAVDARKKAEARIVELESKEVNFTDKLHERDTKVAELSHQLDDLAKYRIQAATEKEAKDQRIQALETQLRQRDAEIAQLGAGASGAGAAELQQQVIDRERIISRLKAEVESLQAAVTPNAPKVAELQAEIAELRATLVATAGAAPTTASEKDAIIGRLNEEVTGLRAAYEAAEQALEEQDAAIDKLTRELVQHQQKLSQLEGRELPVTPRSGSMPRPVSAPVATPVAAHVAAPVAVSMPAPIAPTPIAPIPTPIVPMAATPPVATAQIDEGERTVAVSLADLISKVDSAPAAAPPPSPSPTTLAEVNESTVAIPLGDLVAQIDTAHAPAVPAIERAELIDTADTVAESKKGIFGGSAAKRPSGPPPTPPPLQLDANESTVAVSLASLIEQVDAAPTPPPLQLEANESTVAVSLAHLIEQVDAAPPATPSTPPPMPPVEAHGQGFTMPSAESGRAGVAGLRANIDSNEATAAFVVPAELLEDDDEPGQRQDGNDLKRIKGIGKATAKRLRSAGITTWVQVANLTDKELPAIADLLKVSVDKIKPWVEQAKALRQG